MGFCRLHTRYRSCLRPLIVTRCCCSKKVSSLSVSWIGYKSGVFCKDITMNHVARSTQYSTPISFKCCHDFPTQDLPFFVALPVKRTNFLTPCLLTARSTKAVTDGTGSGAFGNALSTRESILKRILEGRGVKPVELCRWHSRWSSSFCLAGSQEKGNICFLQQVRKAYGGLTSAACQKDCHDEG